MTVDIDKLTKFLYHISVMKNTKSKKEILDEFADYVENNPGASYAEAAKAMQRSSRTIHRWCDGLGIKLTTPLAGDRSTPTFGFTGEEEEILSKLNETINKASKNMNDTQERMLHKNKQIAELESQIISAKDALERQKREFYKVNLKKQREACIQAQQDYDMALQKAWESSENRVPINETTKRVEEQTSPTAQRPDWTANMDKVLEGKTLSQLRSLLDDLVKMVTFVNALGEWIYTPSSGHISYQASSLEEYRSLMALEYRWSGKQARDEMLKSVLSPLKDYLFQRFGAGLQ